jgi:chemotaxis signal transduction protein
MHNELELDKFIVFQVADYLLALPISNVLKVVISPANSKSLTAMGLMQLGKYMIKFLDLHQQLNSSGLANRVEHLSFIVVAHDSQGELYGFSVDEPPDLVELPKDTIRSLPKSSSHSQPMIEMVSHVAVISQKEVLKTIFLLDLTRIAQLI